MGRGGEEGRGEVTRRRSGGGGGDYKIMGEGGVVGEQGKGTRRKKGNGGR